MRMPPSCKYLLLSPLLLTACLESPTPNGPGKEIAASARFQVAPKRVPWYAKHGMTLTVVNDLNVSLQVQGYRMNWLSAYTVNGSVFFAAVWQVEPTPGPQQSVKYSLSSDQYTAEVTAQKNAGFRLALVSAYTVNNVPKFSAVFQKKTGNTLFARHGMTSSQYQTEVTNRKNSGFRLVHVSPYVVNNVDFYAGIWVQQDPSNLFARHFMTASEYQTEYTNQKAKGFRISQVSGYKLNGTVRYVAIWENLSGLPPVTSTHGMTNAQYQQKFNDNYVAGYRPVMVNGFDVGGSENINAIWENFNYNTAELKKIDDQVNATMAIVPKDGAGNPIPGQIAPPSISIAITSGGRLVFAKAYGNAILNNPTAGTVTTPASTATRYRFMSVSKSITSVAIMRMYDWLDNDNNHVLDLDKKVFRAGGALAEYETSVSTEMKDITTRQLLQHISAAWGQTDRYSDPKCNDPTLALPQSQTLQQVFNFALGCGTTFDGFAVPNRMQPGSRYSYSNMGYTVLARILEKTAGYPLFTGYEQMVKDWVLSQSGITDMELGGKGGMAENQLAPNEAHYYGPGNPYAWNVPRMDGHGGWIATPIDLARFITHADGLNGDDILAPGTFGIMTTVSDKANYACGWVVDAQIWHNGALDGTSSIIIRTPGGLTLSAVSNCRNIDLATMCNNITAANVAWPTDVNFF